LQENNVRRATLAGLPIDLFRDFRQRANVRVNTYEKFLRLATSRSVDKNTIAGSDVDDNAPFVGRNETLEFLRLDSSDGTTTNSFQHNLLLQIGC
jgi:hypothetical protein